MARAPTKAKKVTPTPPATPPAAKRTLEPHELLLSPTIQSAVGVQAWGKFAGDADLNVLIEDLQAKVRQVQDGDMRPVEAMLYGQALTLETIFTSLARRATSQEYLKQVQTFLGLALKAQAQCRATLEALAEIKNPRQVLIAKQANINNGQQQVNNGASPVASAVSTETGPVRAGAHAGQTTSQQNGLLEASHGIELDPRAQSSAGGADPHLETVATGHRAAHA